MDEWMAICLGGICLELVDSTFVDFALVRNCFNCEQPWFANTLVENKSVHGKSLPFQNRLGFGHSRCSGVGPGRTRRSTIAAHGNLGVVSLLRMRFLTAVVLDCVRYCVLQFRMVAMQVLLPHMLRARVPVLFGFSCMMRPLGSPERGFLDFSLV